MHAKDLSTCYEDQEISDAALLMEQHHIRHMPILHKDNTLAGILTVDDIAKTSHHLAGAVLESAVAIH